MQTTSLVKIAILSVSISFQGIAAETPLFRKAAKKELVSRNYGKAMKSYAKAAKTNRNDSFSRKMFILLRKVLRQEKAFKIEKNSTRKELLGKQIRIFFLSCHDFAKVLEIDRELYKTDTSISNLCNLTTSLINQNKDSEAVKLLESKKRVKNQSITLLKALLAARQGKVDNVTKLCKAISIVKLKDYEDLIILARVYANKNEVNKVATILTKAFKVINPKFLPLIKRNVKTYSDFAKIKTNPEFKKAMLTKSDIAISECGDCGSCSSKKSCDK